jgi:hypothetical protein
MTNDELIQALKEDAEWAHANEWETPITLGDHLDAAVNALESLQTQLADARNELCQKCGRYREAHKGACDGCRWKEMP